MSKCDLEIPKPEIILQNRGPSFATTLTSLRAIKNGLQPWRECPRLAP